MTDGPEARLAQHRDLLQDCALWVRRAFGHEPGSPENAGLVTLILAIRQAPLREAAEIMQHAIEDMAAGPPPHTAFGDLRADAEFWADCATPAEIEAVTAAGLRRIDRALFAEAARKRILVAMWESLPDPDRRTFLRRVDPDGRFRRVA